MLALSQMAEQINTKLHQHSTDSGNGHNHNHNHNQHNSSSNSNGNNSSSASSNAADSVDLDNLFAFLSEVTPTSNVNALIDEIGEKMENLVDDLDEELESVIQQEIEGLNLERPANSGPKKGMGLPSLPEPTMPPPPPPTSTTTNTVVATPKVAPKPSTAIISKTKVIVAGREEPIYEAVIPREELPIVPELPEPPFGTHHRMAQGGIIAAVEKEQQPSHHNHHPDVQSAVVGHKLRPKSPAVTNVVRSTSPGQRAGGGSGPLSPSSPKHSRPSSRSSSTGPGHSHSFTERDQRRKHRVEKKLQEMQDATTGGVVGGAEREVPLNEVFFDVLEFAENNFNVHERTPEGTIMQTLTRKGSRKSSEDIVPKYEMITFYRGNSIPSSHIHMYDPENVTVACNIFRELNKYMRGELNAEKELHAIQYIIGQGIEREELRDEIFVQCLRQATNNPHSEWLDRVWLLTCLVIVAFQPSKLLLRYFVSFLKKNLESLDGKMRQYVQWCLDNCKYTKVSARTHAPSSVEVAVSN